MRKIQKLMLLSVTIGLAMACFPKASEAVTITYSDRTKEVSPFFELKGDYDLPLNINISGGVGLAPNLSSFVLPVEQNQVSGDPLGQIKSLLKWDALVDLEANLGYNLNLIGVDLGIGKLTAIVTPYLGYRHMMTFTGQLDGDQIQTQTQGINYGGKLKIGLPLGFSGFAHAGATSLIGGSFDKAGDTQPIQANGLILPSLGAGVAWRLPIVNLANVYAGYRAFYLPRDLRIQPNYSQNTELVHGINVGFNILFFGI